MSRATRIVVIETNECPYPYDTVAFQRWLSKRRLELLQFESLEQAGLVLAEARTVKAVIVELLMKLNPRSDVSEDTGLHAVNICYGLNIPVFVCTCVVNYPTIQAVRKMVPKKRIFTKPIIIESLIRELDRI